MKKRSEWQRKSKKREARKNRDRGIVDLLHIIRHFFGHLPDWVAEMKDPRHPAYITYTQCDLFSLVF